MLADFILSEPANYFAHYSCYKALGNSVAIPCVEYIMRGIAMAVTPVK